MASRLMVFGHYPAMPAFQIAGVGQIEIQPVEREWVCILEVHLWLPDIPESQTTGVAVLLLLLIAFVA